MSWLFGGPSLTFLSSTAIVLGEPAEEEEDDVALLHSITAAASTATTTLAVIDSYSVPDNALLAGDYLEYHWEGSLLQNDTAQTAQFAVYYDNVQVFSYTTASIAQNSNRRRWLVSGRMAVRTPATQYSAFEGELSNVSAVATNAVTGVGSGYALNANTTDFDAGPKVIDLRARFVTSATAADIRIDLAKIARYRTA